MIKGIIALFTSGILTNPLVLLGIITGACLYAFFSGAEIFALYKNPLLYVGAFAVSTFYVLRFRRVYQPDGSTDWQETLLAIIGGTFKLVVASLLMISFISLFDLGSSSNDTDVILDLES